MCVCVCDRGREVEKDQNFLSHRICSRMCVWLCVPMTYYINGYVCVLEREREREGEYDQSLLMCMSVWETVFPWHHWGEPERAPHRCVTRSQCTYIYMLVCPSLSRAPLYMYCMQTCNIFYRPHEKIMRFEADMHSACATTMCFSQSNSSLIVFKFDFLAVRVRVLLEILVPPSLNQLKPREKEG